MLGLILWNEFRRRHLPAATFSLLEPDGRDAAEFAVDRIVSIAYPTGDIQTALRAFFRCGNGCFESPPASEL